MMEYWNDGYEKRKKIDSTKNVVSTFYLDISCDLRFAICFFPVFPDFQFRYCDRIRLALVPPNPKELVMACLMLAWRITLGT